MAQWEERDPRWLVDELGRQGSNVNGWHWEETNKFSWTKQRIAEILGSLEADLDSRTGEAKINGLKDVTGEAYLTRRKGNKTLLVYDLNITLSWEGKLTDDEKKVPGTMKISEFCLGSDADDYLIETNSEVSEQKYQCLKDSIHALQGKIRQLLLEFDSELRQLQQ